MTTKKWHKNRAPTKDYRLGVWQVLGWEKEVMEKHYLDDSHEGQRPADDGTMVTARTWDEAVRKMYELGLNDPHFREFIAVKAIFLFWF